MADHDEVTPVDVTSGQPGASCPFGPVDVGIQENNELADSQPECGTAVPIKGRRHVYRLLLRPFLDEPLKQDSQRTGRTAWGAGPRHKTRACAPCFSSA